MVPIDYSSICPSFQAVALARYQRSHQDLGGKQVELSKFYGYERVVGVKDFRIGNGSSLDIKA
jgi:hypothetical protein